VSLTSQEQVRLSRRRAVKPDAYDAYLKGWHVFNKGRFGDAAGFFDEAATKDPSYALAHAMLFEALSMIAFGQDAAVPERALSALRRASELDDSLAEVHTGRGDIEFWWNWNWAAGEREYRKAVELDPISVDSAHHLAMCLHVLRRWDEAEREYRRAVDLDPVSARINTGLLTMLVDARRFDAAVEQFRNAIKINPDHVGLYRQAIRMFEAMGRSEEAEAARATADRLASRRGGEPEHNKSPRLLQLAAAALRVGDREAAMRALEAAYSQRQPQLAWLNARAEWHPLRSDQRFQTTLRKMNFPD
jgi:tetratricopeptide (TPR) repeat protein